MKLKSKKVVRTVEIILGLVLILFGANVFFQFMGGEPAFNEAGTAFLTALFNTGYILPLMGIVFLASGIMFVLHRCSALGAIILFPITLNIVLFHLMLDTTGTAPGLIMFILNVYLIWVYSDRYKPMCK